MPKINMKIFLAIYSLEYNEILYKYNLVNYKFKVILCDIVCVYYYF